MMYDVIPVCVELDVLFFFSSVESFRLRWRVTMDRFRITRHVP